MQTSRSQCHQQTPPPSIFRCRMLLATALLVWCATSSVTQAFFVDIIKDDVGPETYEDVIPRVWYRGRRTDPLSDDLVLPPPEGISGTDKRKAPDLLPVRFVCNKRTAFCKNGGKGPRVSISRKGYGVCVCLCPPYYRGKQCSPNSQQFRRSGRQRYV